MLKSAGILIYRCCDERFEVLLVHSNGREDLEPWSIPKGEYDPEQEAPAHAAVREVREEIGLSIPEAELISLGDSTYRNKRKRVAAFAWCLASSEPDLKLDPWEITKVQFFSAEHAQSKLHEAQVIFLERLRDRLCI